MILEKIIYFSVRGLFNIQKKFGCLPPRKMFLANALPKCGARESFVVSCNQQCVCDRSSCNERKVLKSSPNCRKGWPMGFWKRRQTWRSDAFKNRESNQSTMPWLHHHPDIWCMSLFNYEFKQDKTSREYLGLTLPKCTPIVTLGNSSLSGSKTEWTRSRPR